MFFSLGTSSSQTLPSGSVICRRTLPLVSLPKDTVPVASASTPLSLGERASNSSATRGKPPVMSRVFWPSIGIRANTSPGPTSWPSRTCTKAPTGKPIVTEWSVPGILTSLPVASISFTCGRTTLAEPRCLGSMTTKVDKPVTSSTCRATVKPSCTFSKFALPANSVIMGRVSGSQLAKIAPAFTA